MAINDINKENNTNSFIVHNQNDNNKRDKLKNVLLIEPIYVQKYSANNHEIPLSLFYEIKIEAFGNCLYCCISY